MPDELPPFDKELFFVSPIGSERTPERERNDIVFEHIVAEAAQKVGLVAVRADQISRPGNISVQVIEHVLQSAAVVADLTTRNANVYYELGIRHAVRKPAVLISEDRDLPFDIAQLRTIFFDANNIGSAKQCTAHVVAQLQAALSGDDYSPVSTALDLAALSGGGALERTLSDIFDAIQALSARLDPPAPIYLPSEDDLRRFGLAVQRRRTSLGLSVADLSERARLTRTAVEKIERGERDPKLHIVVRLAEALEMDPGDLIGLIAVMAVEEEEDDDDE